MWPDFITKILLYHVVMEEAGSQTSCFTQLLFRRWPEEAVHSIANDLAIHIESGLQTIKIMYVLSQGVCIDIGGLIKACLSRYL